MNLLITTSKSKTVITYPEDSAVNDLHQAEIQRAIADDAWWSNLVHSLVLFSLVGICAWQGSDDQALLSICLFGILGQLASKLWIRSATLRQHAKAHTRFVSETKDDPSWEDPNGKYRSLR
jgi:hypothetical protein